MEESKRINGDKTKGICIAPLRYPLLGKQGAFQSFKRHIYLNKVLARDKTLCSILKAVTVSASAVAARILCAITDSRHSFLHPFPSIYLINPSNNLSWTFFYFLKLVEKLYRYCKHPTV
jgi:hypothetical protein